MVHYEFENVHDGARVWVGLSAAQDAQANAMGIAWDAITRVVGSKNDYRFVQRFVPLPA